MKWTPSITKFYYISIYSKLEALSFWIYFNWVLLHHFHLKLTLSLPFVKDPAQEEILDQIHRKNKEVGDAEQGQGHAQEVNQGHVIIKEGIQGRLESERIRKVDGPKDAEQGGFFYFVEQNG